MKSNIKNYLFRFLAFVSANSKPWIVVSLIVVNCGFFNVSNAMKLSVSGEHSKQDGIIWAKTILEREVDYIEYIDENRVLVGTLHINGQLWDLKYEYIYMLDANTGNVIWKLKRNNFYGNRQDFICSKPVILIQSINYQGGKTKFSAISNETGELIWEKHLRNRRSTTTYHSENNVLIIAEKEGKSLAVTLMDVFSGEVIAFLEFDTDTRLKKEELHLHLIKDNLIISLCDRIYSIDLNTYDLKWERPFLTGEQGAIHFFPDGENLIIYVDDHLEKLNSFTGELLWSLSSENDILNVYSAEDQLVIFQGTGDDTGCMTELLSYTDYKEVWSLKFSGALASPMINDDNTLYFTNVSQLFSVDKQTGNVNYTKEIPSPLCFDDQLPDNIIVLDDKICISRELGIMLCNKKSGEIVFTDYVPGTFLYTSGYNIAKLAAFYLGKNDPKSNKSKNVNSLSEFKEQFKSGTLESAQVYAERRNKALRDIALKDIMDSKTGDYDERIGGFKVSVGGSTYEANMGEVLALKKMMFGIVDMLDEGLRNMQKINADRIKAFINVYTLRMGYPSRLHNKSLFGSYYIRPYYDNGWYLKIVDLMRSKKASVFLCPGNIEALRTFPKFINFDIFNGILITNGVDMGVNQHETDKYAVYDEKGIPDRQEFLYPDIVALDLNKLSFSDISGYLSEIQVDYTVSESDKTFTEAIIQKDKEEYNHLLEQGANVNACDEYGISALMYAAIIDDKKLAKVLLEKGADLNYADANGWTAMHYSIFFNGYVNKCFGLLGKHVRRQ